MSVFLLLSLCAVFCACVDSAKDVITCPVISNYTSRCHCTIWEIKCSRIGSHDDLPVMFTEYENPFSNITISDANITNIPNDIMLGMKTREIFLVGNNIESIESDAFSFHRPILESLYLSNNRLTIIKTGTFAGLTKLIRLKLDGNLLTSIDGHVFRQLPILRNLYLHNNRLETVEDRVFPQSLDSLTLYRNRMKTLPPDALQGLNNLTLLNLRENKFVTFPTRLFLDLKSLRSLDLSWNNLTTIDKDLFRNTVELYSMDLALNNILYIHPESFSNVKKLSFLDLSNNKIQVIPGPLFANLAELRTLYLSNNLLTELPDDMSSGMTQLRTLHIQYNQLNSIGRTPLLNIILLEDLKLDHNAIAHIGFGAFDHLGSLKEIDLSDNMLSELFDDPFQSSRKLEWLDLSYNQITTITEKYFRDLPKIKFLDLSGNRIHRLAAESFRNQTELQYLNLTNNWLERLEDGTFENNNMVTILKMDTNPLQELSNGVLSGLESLEKLLLNNTCIRELPDDLFLGIDTLTAINMQNSRLRSIQNETFSSLDNLAYLDLSHNDISLVEAGALAAPYIQTIKLSHNKISASGVRATTAEMSSSVNYLDISYNDVTDLVGITPLIFKEIESLFFAGNPFVCDCDSETEWMRTLGSLQDYDKVVCHGPARNLGIKVICIDEGCDTNVTYSARPFDRVCNRSSRVDVTSPEYLKDAQHIRTTIRNVCDLSLYTTTTMSTRPASTTTNAEGHHPGGVNEIRIMITIEPDTKQDAVNVIWDVPENDVGYTRGFRITHRKKSSGKITVLFMMDPERNRYSLTDLDSAEDYVICVEVLVEPDQSRAGGSNCQDFRTESALPELTGSTLIIIITVAAMLSAILFILIIVCVCLRRQRRKSKGKKVGMKHASQSLSTRPQTWLAPDVTLVGNQNDQRSIHSDTSGGKNEKTSGLFDGTDIWLDANIVSDPFPDDSSQSSYSHLRRGNSELSVRPDSWYQRDQVNLSRSASDVGKSNKLKKKQKNKKTDKVERRDSTMARAGMWVDSFDEPPIVHVEEGEESGEQPPIVHVEEGDERGEQTTIVHVEEGEELGEQTTLSINIFDDKSNVTNGGLHLAE